jgi:hypothetical protein
MEKSNRNIFRYVIIAAVIVVALILLINHKSSTSAPTTASTATVSANSSGATAAPAAVTAAIANVSQSTLTTIGAGTALASPLPIKAPALSENSKPEVFFEGAEFCPYCATERWALAIALAKFGTFTNLKVTHSSSSDVYPNTQTISFYGSTYTSSYLTFTPVEIYTNIPDGSGYTTLQTPTSAENEIANTYDATPYLPSQEAGSIPFIDFGGSYLIAGATYSPSVLQGKSATQIAAALSNPSSSIAKGADGAANTIITSICKITSDQPSSVCVNTDGANEPAP